MKLKDFYTNISVIVLNFIVLILLVNFCTALLFFVKDNWKGTPNPVSLRYPDLDLAKIHPHMTNDNIHQLLMETYARGRQEFIPYVQFRERSFSGRYVNISKHGFRFVKNQGPWPINQDNYNIFVFGGSTTFGYGVADNQTIPSYLQDIMERATVYNFGRAGYFSTMERILYEKLLSLDHIPDMVIFIDGTNDFASYENMKDRPQNTREFELYMNDPVGASIERLFLSTSLVKGFKRIANKVMKHRQDSTPEPHYIFSDAVNRYINNKKIIDAVSDDFGVRSVFVWQPHPAYKFDLEYHPYINDDWAALQNPYGYTAMEEMVKNGKLGSNFIWLADIQENRKEILYVDALHYTAAFSKEIAYEIFTFLERKK